MTNNLSDLRSQIADDIDRTDLSSQINFFINRAIEHYQSESFWFTDSDVSFSTVANQQAYTIASISAVIKEIQYVQITCSGNIYELKARTLAEIQQMNTQNKTGQPKFYSWVEGSIYLYNIPDAVYTVKIFHRKNYVDLSADGDNNDFTNNARSLIEFRATSQVNYRTIKNDTEGDKYKNLEGEALSSLRSRHHKIRATNWNKPTEF